MAGLIAGALRGCACQAAARVRGTLVNGEFGVIVQAQAQSVIGKRVSRIIHTMPWPGLAATQALRQILAGGIGFGLGGVLDEQIGQMTRVAR